MARFDMSHQTHSLNICAASLTKNSDNLEYFRTVLPYLDNDQLSVTVVKTMHALQKKE